MSDDIKAAQSQTAQSQTIPVNASAYLPSRKDKTKRGNCLRVCGSTNCWSNEELSEPDTFLSIRLAVSLSSIEKCASARMSGRHILAHFPCLSLSCFLPLLVDGAREELHYVSLAILCLPPFSPCLAIPSQNGASY